jgi:hypothetical protein
MENSQQVVLVDLLKDPEPESSLPVLVDLWWVLEPESSLSVLALVMARRSADVSS